MKHISTIGSAVLLGSVGISVMSVLTGCTAEQEEPANRFLVIEQLSNGKYEVVEETPTEGPSRAIIRERDENGKITERFMNEDEMKALAQQEYDKMESGESELNQAPSGDAGMGLAGTILAVAAGSLLGNMIGNALMGNKNFQRNANNVNKSAYHKSKTSGASGTKSKTKKSFFGGSKTGTSNTKSGSYGG
ncbi:MAG: hypothetical protein U9R50_12390 [Campylobacterota bacterium]|nr:hypothetical protein [Campylobacterota bacterium]